jgi:HD-like signal output (HDOD) protein
MEAVDFNHLSNKINLEDLVLPSPPTLMKRVCMMQRRPYSDVEDIVYLLRDYPFVEDRLLQLANSAIFRSSVEINTVKSAIIRLGVSRVLSMIASMSITQYLKSASNKTLEKYFNHMWQQSLQVSAMAYLLAREKTSIDPEKALFAGLVHNIGVLPLLLSLSNSSQLMQGQQLMMEIADVIVPKYYPYAGRILMQHWQLPDEIIAVSTSHRNFNRASHECVDLCDVVQMAYAINHNGDLDEYYDFERLMTIPVSQFFWDSAESAEENLMSLSDEFEHVSNILAV